MRTIRGPRPLHGQREWIMSVKGLGISNVELADKLGVTEGAVRYQLKCQAEGRLDRRKFKPSRLDPLKGIIALWVEEQKDRRHRQTIKILDEALRRHHGYAGSYDALRRFVGKHHPEFMGKAIRVRVETPPGKLVQVDWKEDMKVQLGDPGRWTTVQAFIFTLAFSRKTLVVPSFGKDLESWLNAHRRAFARLGGLPEVIRCDCLGSAVTLWKGEASVLNPKYARMMRELGIKVFPARPGTPRDKGKVEKKIEDIFGRCDLDHRLWPDLDSLDAEINGQVDRLETQWRCGATGLNVAESFAYEKECLKPMPAVYPILPLKEQRVRVKRDTMAYFMGNDHQVPRVYADKTVLCTFTGREIVIHHEGKELGRWSHLPGTRGMVRLQAGVLEDPELHFNPTVRAWAMEAARRQVDYYQAIIERRSVHDTGAR
jgi:transposase